jgi:ribosomal protein RSM22 (predicted rRNA methylase)
VVVVGRERGRREKKNKKEERKRERKTMESYGEMRDGSDRESKERDILFQEIKRDEREGDTL